eukprot:GFKZ01002676.1.p2 GENE.GFKZ01002676.1~~GFKZ01002676.1.p2  ORF type:complete len:109 (+),score=3.01 GFKZ01002676.1:857-1183(+)
MQIPTFEKNFPSTHKVTALQYSISQSQEFFPDGEASSVRRHQQAIDIGVRGARARGTLRSGGRNGDGHRARRRAVRDTNGGGGAHAGAQGAQLAGDRGHRRRAAAFPR